MKRNKAHSCNYWAFWHIATKQRVLPRSTHNILFLFSQFHRSMVHTLSPHQLNLSFIIRMMDKDSLRMKQ